MTSSYPFLTDEQVERLVANGRESRAYQARDELFDPLPVVKLFTPDAGATWLLTEIDPDEPSMAFGLADLGLGFPELGFVSLDELATVRGHLRLPIEQDTGFRANQAVSAYAAAARAAGRIQA
ncbi:DUF2958 domain-containing protein [uncultured Variovorax sp.]|uniref:DUF2958 domain-containing protein n=1 Tax=uncultured Variovorax sp. TaxID=114708 RepID=UPI0026177736|nr:DUF2958 domain-containing protein [uncultured Variovorax sp.]